MGRGKHDKEKGNKKRMRKLGSTEKTKSREKGELNQRREKKKREAGKFCRTGDFVSPSSCL